MVVLVRSAISWRRHRIGRGLLGLDGVGGPGYGALDRRFGLRQDLVEQRGSGKPPLVVGGRGVRACLREES